MSRNDDVVRITAADVSAAVPLCEPVEEGIGWYRVTTLDFMVKEPGRLGKMFGGGDGISVTIDPSPVDGGVPIWSTQVRFAKGTDIQREFSRTGLEWPVWWSIPDVTHLVEKVRLLEFVAFATPELALPWFVRLHAAANGTDAAAPVVVARSISSPMRSGHQELEDFDDISDDVDSSMLSDELKKMAYGEWQVRATEHGF
jgi:hypothetical protein